MSWNYWFPWTSRVKMPPRARLDVIYILRGVSFIAAKTRIINALDFTRSTRLRFRQLSLAPRREIVRVPLRADIAAVATHAIAVTPRHVEVRSLSFGFPHLPIDVGDASTISRPVAANGTRRSAGRFVIRDILDVTGHNWTACLVMASRARARPW